MPNCTYCGAELPNNARFCSNCGNVPATVSASAQSASMRASPMQSIPPPLPPQTSTPDNVNKEQLHGGGTPRASSSINDPPNGQPPWSGIAPARFTKLPMQSGLGNIPARWLIVGLVLIILLASGLGILTAVVRAHLSSTIPSSTQQTPGFCSNKPLCTPPPNLKTPIGGGSAIVNLTLSGAVNGRLASTRVGKCGVSGTQYDLLVQGKVGGTDYSLIFRINAYRGAGTYNSGEMFTSFTQQPVNVTTTWVNTGNVQATAIIHSNVKAGTMDVNATGVVNSVHITGSWRCG